jgi:hypothetical protein
VASRSSTHSPGTDKEDRPLAEWKVARGRAAGVLHPPKGADGCEEKGTLRSAMGRVEACHLAHCSRHCPQDLTQEQ